MGNPITLEDYFRENLAKGAMYHAVCANIDEKGLVSFYIHADGRDSETPTFLVKDNHLLTKVETLLPIPPL